jgi:hypothetical protein
VERIITLEHYLVIIPSTAHTYKAKQNKNNKSKTKEEKCLIWMDGPVTENKWGGKQTTTKQKQEQRKN